MQYGAVRAGAVRAVELRAVALRLGGVADERALLRAVGRQRAFVPDLRGAPRPGHRDGERPERQGPLASGKGPARPGR